MNRSSKALSRAVLVVLAFVTASTAHALNTSVPRVGGDLTRLTFGSGTGVIVGLLDTGVDTMHEALAGLDSQGNPRLVAQANFVTPNPGPCCGDIANFSHGTPVLGVIGGTDAGRGVPYVGLAPDVRYINARVLDRVANFASDGQVVNGFGFAVANGAAIINASLWYPSLGGNSDSKLSLLADYLSDARGIPVVVSAGNNGNSSPHTANGPGDAYNVFSVAASQRSGNFNQVYSLSSWGIEPDGLARPNITAPGDNIVSAIAGGGYSAYFGTGIAAPFVTGMLASQIEYGRAAGHSTDPLVLRSTMLNSAEKINDRTNAPWAPTAAGTVSGVYSITQPLDDNSGAGQISGRGLIAQYVGGQYSTGSVPATGWDLATISAPAATVDYTINMPLAAGSTVRATLTWNRHVSWSDANSNAIIDAADSFAQSTALSNLNLSLYLDGSLIATSVSTVDNIEQINWTVNSSGVYKLRVERLNVTGAAATERYSLAWSAVPDFNNNSHVDAADYVLWRKNPSAYGGDPAGYNTWRTNFGQGNSGATAAADAVPEGRVPEPRGFLELLGLGMMQFGRRRRKLIARPRNLSVSHAQRRD